MTVRGPIALLALVLAACAPAARPAATPVPAPESPPPATPAAPAPAPATPLLEAPEDWQLRDLEADRLPGTGVNRAYQELLADIAPTRTVVVAVIDSGVDTAHVDLRANLWRNEREVPGNGIDDDGNGYVDDVHGWNFIGGVDGEQVRYDTFEVTRLHVACESEAPAEAERRAECAEIAADFENRRREAEETLQQIGLIKANLDIVLPMLRAAIGTDSLTVANVTELRSSRSDVMQARSYYLTLMGAGITPEAVEEAETAYGTQLEYNLNPAFDPRAIVGDDYSDPDERVYGNAEMMGPDAKHGTHVAGIIAAVRDNGIGVDGIAPDVRIMVLRAVPDGDERDKDVANAIRYAVDNGAHIINMSFGKAWSPAKAVVDAAVRHADENGVLLIHAAGNDGEDLASSSNYPNRRYLEGGEARNWIEVGASSWKPADSLVAPFSNYGRAEVDLFAPGVDILSTVPGGGIQRQNGTSMAAPVVTGIAALLMAYFPELGAADVRRILLETATSHADRPVLRPGTPGGETVPFGQLSVTGGVVNAYEAVRRAAQTRVRT